MSTSMHRPGAGGGLPPLIEGLLRPEAYPHPTSHVQLVQTHISYVLLTGPFAYKIKKPVRFGFLDYSSPALRELYCHEEIRLNRRLCPQIYKGVVPVVSLNGDFRVEAAGKPVEHAVKMVQLPADRMMDALLRMKRVRPTDLERLARRLSTFYATVATGPGVDHFGTVETIRFNSEENFRQTVPFVGRTLTAEQHGQAAEFTQRFLARRAALLAERVVHGRIRDGHGDLRPSSVCFTDGLCVYDCVEFNARLRCGDVASDVAFLTMELDHAGRRDLARVFVQSFAHHSRDEGLLELLPFYKLYRAWVRGKVESLKLDEPEISAVEHRRAAQAARSYFDLATTYATGHQSPFMLVLTGTSSAGRSALGAALSAHLGWGLVSPETTDDRPYAIKGGGPMRAAVTHAWRILKDGESAILDASLLGSEPEEEARALADEVGARLWLVECTDYTLAPCPTMHEAPIHAEDLTPWHVTVDVRGPIEESVRCVVESIEAATI